MITGTGITVLVGRWQSWLVTITVLSLSLIVITGISASTRHLKQLLSCYSFAPGTNWERAQILEQALNHCGMVWILRQDQRSASAALSVSVGGSHPPKSMVLHTTSYWQNLLWDHSKAEALLNPLLDYANEIICTILQPVLLLHSSQPSKVHSSLGC